MLWVVHYCLEKKKKYVCKLITQRDISPQNNLLLSLCYRRFISWHSGNLNTDASLNIITWKGVIIRHGVVSHGGCHEDYGIQLCDKTQYFGRDLTPPRGEKDTSTLRIQVRLRVFVGPEFEFWMPIGLSLKGLYPIRMRLCDCSCITQISRVRYEANEIL